VSKAKPGNVEAVNKDLEETARALGDMSVERYLAMVKADVKPTLSVKPVTEHTAPQVIVYHEKPLSALYSSVFRVLVRRFLSLLKPTFHLNLLKDMTDIKGFLNAVHPFGETNLKYLENDFSKYDKSQSAFVFALEEFVFRQLGLNEEFLAKWVAGHVDCSIHSFSVGLSLHVMYQRKSGDATTAFGNGILNILSVCYAYAGSDIVWACFMGDDSIACVRTTNANEDAIQILAEVFNLLAKYYVTDAPYYASTFIDINDELGTVELYPDPIKRVERMSMHVSADDPQWRERFISYQDSLAPYKSSAGAGALSRLVPQRYDADEGFVRAAAAALGTIASSYPAFRGLWEDKPEDLAA